MWFLFIIFLNVNGVPGLNTKMVLQTYATSQECLQERDRISEEMARAYPEDHDFVLACQVNRKYNT
jgi:hypothetical protein